MAKVVYLSLSRKTAETRIDVVQYTTAPDIVFIIEDYTPTGRADIYIEKPSGEEIYNSCTIDGNKIIFTPTTQCFAEVGEQKAQLQILDGDKLAVSFPIKLIVAENIIDSDAAESTSEFTELQAAISTIGQYDQKIADVEQDMADTETRVNDNMAATITTVNNTLAPVLEDITGLTGRMVTAEEDIDDLEEIVGKVEKIVAPPFSYDTGQYDLSIRNTTSMRQRIQVPAALTTSGTELCFTVPTPPLRYIGGMSGPAVDWVKIATARTAAGGYVQFYDDESGSYRQLSDVVIYDGYEYYGQIIMNANPIRWKYNTVVSEYWPIFCNFGLRLVFSDVLKVGGNPIPNNSIVLVDLEFGVGGGSSS